MDKVKVKVSITDEVSPPGEPVVTLRVKGGGKAIFRRVAPNKNLSEEMTIPEERVEELRTMRYLVEEVAPKKAKKAEPAPAPEKKEEAS